MPRSGGLRVVSSAGEAVVTATVIDATRARVTYEYAFQYVDSRAYVPTEQTVIERLGRVEL
jgi:hypothetical protein